MMISRRLIGEKGHTPEPGRDLLAWSKIENFLKDRIRELSSIAVDNCSDRSRELERLKNF